MEKKNIMKSFYVRHPDTNKSFGMIAYKAEPALDTKGVCTGELWITYAFSFCHPRDKFIKKMAHTIAEGRLEKGGTYTCTVASDIHKTILLSLVKNETNHLPKTTRAAVAYLLGSCVKFSDKILNIATQSEASQPHLPSLDANVTASMKEIYEHCDLHPVFGNMLGGPQQSEGHKCCGKCSMK